MDKRSQLVDKLLQSLHPTNKAIDALWMEAVFDNDLLSS